MVVAGKGQGCGVSSREEINKSLSFLVQVECNSKLDPTKTTLLKVQGK